MKKFLMVMLMVLTALFLFSCVSDDDEKEIIDEGQTDTTPGGHTDGGTDSGSDDTAANDSDTTDTGNVPDSDPDNNTGIPDDTTDPAGQDTDPLPDDSDPQPDDDADDPTDDSGDTVSDSGDTTPDEDAAEPADSDNEPSSGLPECSKTSSFPCEDTSSRLIWSGKSASTSNWNKSKNDCESMGSGWGLPTIDDLRTLVLNCAETATGGDCNVREGCLSETQCYSSTYCVSKNCPTRNDGSYSIFGDTDYLWSSSEMDGDSNRAWYLNFKFAAIGSSDKSTSDLAYTRCVKK